MICDRIKLCFLSNGLCIFHPRALTRGIENAKKVIYHWKSLDYFYQIFYHIFRYILIFSVQMRHVSRTSHLVQDVKIFTHRKKFFDVEETFKFSIYGKKIKPH